jgi:hypothetical protein
MSQQLSFAGPSCASNAKIRERLSSRWDQPISPVEAGKTNRARKSSLTTTRMNAASLARSNKTTNTTSIDDSTSCTRDTVNERKNMYTFTEGKKIIHPATSENCRGAHVKAGTMEEASCFVCCSEPSNAAFLPCYLSEDFVNWNQVEERIRSHPSEVTVLDNR